MMTFEKSPISSNAPCHPFRLWWRGSRCALHQVRLQQLCNVRVVGSFDQRAQDMQPFLRERFGWLSDICERRRHVLREREIIQPDDRNISWNIEFQIIASA